MLWAAELRSALADEVSACFLGAVADELGETGLALTLVPGLAWTVPWCSPATSARRRDRLFLRS